MTGCAGGVIASLLLLLPGLRRDIASLLLLLTVLIKTVINLTLDRCYTVFSPLVSPMVHWSHRWSTGLTAGLPG